MSNTTTTQSQKQNTGEVVQIIGPTMDVRFEENLPSILNAIHLENPITGELVVVEVAQHLGNNLVRCIAMSSTDGLVRGAKAVDTGEPVTVPVGKETLGRMFNMLGQTIDGKGNFESKKKSSIHQKPPTLEERETATQIFETGIKAVDLLAPYSKGGKVGLFGGAGVQQAFGNQHFTNAMFGRHSTPCTPNARNSAPILAASG